MGQLVQVSGGRCSARQLLWSKAETEVAQAPSHDPARLQSQGIWHKYGRALGAVGVGQLRFPGCLKGWHMPASLILPPPLGRQQTCRFEKTDVDSSRGLLLAGHGVDAGGGRGAVSSSGPEEGRPAGQPGVLA